MFVDETQKKKIADLAKLEVGHINGVLDALDKMELCITHISKLEAPRREVEITKIENFVRDYLSTLDKPKGILGVFPYQEFARRLVKEFNVQ